MFYALDGSAGLFTRSGLLPDASPKTVSRPLSDMSSTRSPHVLSGGDRFQMSHHYDAAEDNGIEDEIKEEDLERDGDVGSCSKEEGATATPIKDAAAKPKLLEEEEEWVSPTCSTTSPISPKIPNASLSDVDEVETTVDDLVDWMPLPALAVSRGKVSGSSEELATPEESPEIRQSNAMWSSSIFDKLAHESSTSWRRTGKKLTPSAIGRALGVPTRGVPRSAVAMLLPPGQEHPLSKTCHGAFLPRVNSVPTVLPSVQAPPPPLVPPTTSSRQLSESNFSVREASVVAPAAPGPGLRYARSSAGSSAHNSRIASAARQHRAGVPCLDMSRVAGQDYDEDGDDEEIQPKMAPKPKSVLPPSCSMPSLNLGALRADASVVQSRASTAAQQPGSTQGGRGASEGGIAFPFNAQPPSRVQSQGSGVACAPLPEVAGSLPALSKRSPGHADGEGEGAAACAAGLAKRGSTDRSTVTGASLDGGSVKLPTLQRKKGLPKLSETTVHVHEHCHFHFYVKVRRPGQRV